MAESRKNSGSCEGCVYKILAEYKDIPSDPECEAGHDYQVQNDLGCEDYEE